MVAVFQQLEVDYIIGRPNKDVHVTDLAEVPIIRMYGVTESGSQGPAATHSIELTSCSWTKFTNCTFY